MNLSQLNFYAITGFWGVLVILLVIASVALLAFVWIRLMTKRQRFQKAILDLEKKKSEINSLPIGFKLLKLERIGNNNVVYAEVHREYKKNYDDLVNEFNRDFTADYAICQRELNEKNYRKLTETLQIVNNKLDNYDAKMKQMSEQISQLTKDEDETRKLEAELKTRNRECYERYQRNHHDLDILQAEFKEYFHRIDDKFQTYEEYMFRGSYTDAKEILMMIKDNLNEIERQIEVAPKYTVILTKEIPQAMNKVIDKYNEMQSKKYPLFHVLANATINNLKDRLTAIVSQLKSFEYEGIDGKIEDIYKDIEALNKQLNDEKSARDRFDNELDKVYDEAENLERFYIKHIKKVAEFKKYYVVNQEQDALESKLKQEIQKLSVIRRSLDGLNYGNQAYSTRINKLNDLINQVRVVDECKNQILNNIEGMKDSSDNAYNLVTDGSTRLRNLEIQVRNSRVDKIIQYFADDFVTGYDLVEKLQELFDNVPVEVDKLQLYRSELVTLLNKLQNEAGRQIADAKYAEKLLMYANYLRVETGGDKLRAISKAELYYYDGKYEDAIRIALSSLDSLPSFLERNHE